MTVYDLTVEKEWETIEVSNEAEILPQDEEDIEIIEESAPSSSRTVKRRKITSAFTAPRFAAPTSIDHPLQTRYEVDDDSEEEIIVVEGDDVDSYVKRKWFPNPQEFAPPHQGSGAVGRDRGNVIKDIAMDPGNDLFVVARAE